MVQAEMERISESRLKGVISGLYDYFEKNGDLESAHKVKQLGWKYGAKEQAIAFCGHFSAGKSSLINRIAGEDILPSSPIPTSANLVKVKSGEEYAKVFFKKDIPWLYLPPYDYEAVKSHCLDGDEIEEIEISRQGSSLPENTVILDTPGIDSADDAHRIATESAIHLADLVFYVMDYNHVQSEVNFLFTKELQDAGKEVYLVVNQIDKHREDELSFLDFKESVEASFRSWGVSPAGIFYTSLKKPSHKENQYSDLEKLIHTKLGSGWNLLEDSTLASLGKIAQDYILNLSLSQEEERARLNELLAANPFGAEDSLEERSRQINEELSRLEDSAEQALRELDEKAGQILNNAYLMPFETRELANAYLESEQPGFKVGFLFTAGKTTAEKKSRRDTFLEAVSEKTKQQAEWHIRDLLLGLLKEKGIRDAQLEGMARNFSIPVSIELLEKPLKKGALLSGDYLLTYTDELSAEIKKAARDRIFEFNKEYSKAIRGMAEKLADGEKRELELLAEAKSARIRLSEMDADCEAAKNELDTIIGHTQEIGPELPEWLFRREDENVKIIRGESFAKAATIENEFREIRQGTPKKLETQAETGEAIALRLRDAAQIIETLPGFAHMAGELREKAGKLEKSSYTVALFGAFSAGKSSFANALIGGNILPVSPNPTTASICRIKPVDNEHPHGTVVVKMKEPDSLLADVNKALKFFSGKAASLEEALDKTRELEKRPFQGETAEKANLSFLNAFENGYSAARENLGTKIYAGMADFADFVAKEEKSCFAEWIDLYYDCPLTRMGISLVDTPGADSINARHTGVAFNYIKNADAILFVTYYNHAFSRADREFLIQLGRVKEVFELDKMFFIVNAIDLAKDEEEKELVLNYVKGQLANYGVRNPSLHPLSSLLALKEKMDGDVSAVSGISGFEEPFFRFINEGLASMAAASAIKDLEHAAKRVSSLVASAKDAVSNAEARRRQLKELKSEASSFIFAQTSGPLEQRISQEVQELVHYCKQRVFLRFGDFFRESFNPSVLNSGSRNIKKSLDGALGDLLDSLGHDLGQEMRATALRIEKFTARAVSDFREGLVKDLSEMCEGISFSGFDFPKPRGIEFPAGLSDLDRSKFSKQLALFKNPKDFFEKNGKKVMQEQLEAALSPGADSYLSSQSERLDVYGRSLAGQLFDSIAENLRMQVENHFTAMFEVLDGGIDADRLEESLKQLQSLSK
ncbi:Dynamin family protein [Neobacillus piezotolerans]|uniref:Dynamin family protein n=1 Tax=Neobacillus piezotolerans TaxID=2259171 RepID=A0A3D8GQT5_9BACI|nr:dynamin family protein [Neobacillus piezotolerans]RDU36406.1 Dynamin family protein [Neobacillus piezotolerans]